MEEEEDKEEEEARRGGEVEKRVGVHAKAEVATCVWSVCWECEGAAGAESHACHSMRSQSYRVAQGGGWQRVWQASTVE